MIALLEDNRERVAALCRQYGVRRLEVFGSAAKGTFDTATSDLDLLVTYPDGYDFGPWLGRHFELRQRLTEVFRRPVDLVMVDALRHEWFRHQVEASREVLFDVAEDAALAR